jgi:hypothetical protein
MPINLVAAVELVPFIEFDPSLHLIMECTVMVTDGIE